MKHNKTSAITISLLILLLLIVAASICREENTAFSILQFADESSTSAPAELSEQIQYTQMVPVLFDNIEGLSFFFANYSDRNNTGTVYLQAESEGRTIGRAQFDASVIRDGEYLAVWFDEIPARGSIVTVRISADSPAGQAVTIWSKKNDFLYSNGAEFLLNDVMQENQLVFQYLLSGKTPKLSRTFYCVFAALFVCYVLSGVPRYLLKWLTTTGRGKKLCLYLFLWFAGTLLISLRNLEFVSVPILYGEDALFLSNQLKRGLLAGLFQTRGGGSADFSNTGIYILTFLAAKTTGLFDGYSLAQYPFWAGIYGNLFLSFTGVLLFRAVELLCGKKAALAAYASVIFMYLGPASSEVLGRILNTGFMFTVTCAAALTIRYTRRAYDLESFLEDVLCFICAFSFPVCFLEVGLYLCLVALDTLYSKEIGKNFLRNWIPTVTLFAGIIMLPRLLTSEGLGIAFEYKGESVIEFYLARHVLFPFVRFFYSRLTDSMVILLFLSYLVLVCAALVIQKKQYGWRNGLTLFTGMTFGVCFSSAYMRRTMTALFDNYSSTYPDRYYYACNILSMTLGIMCAVIIVRRIWKGSKKPCVELICACAIASLLIDPYLFNFTDWEPACILGGEYQGTIVDSCRDALTIQNVTGSGMIRVEAYPVGWGVEFPVEYVVETAADNDIR